MTSYSVIARVVRALTTLFVAGAFAFASLAAGLAGSGNAAEPVVHGVGVARVPLLIKFHANAHQADIDGAIRATGGVVARDLAQIRTKVIYVPADARDRMLAAYANHASVERVAPAVTMSRAGVPSDPDYAQQWALQRIAWDIAYESIPITGTANLAILDTGIDASHPDLSGRVVAAQSFTGGDPSADPNGHGTALAGIAAANADDGIGMAGVAYAGTSISSVQVLRADGTGYDSDIVAGVLWAADNGANVILMGFSSAEYSAALADALAYAWSRGVLLVAATGNDGSSSPTYPAELANVIGVAATGEDDAVSAASNTGSAMLGAPGTGIYATAPGGGYTSISGTSASAAEVAGLAALLIASGKINATAADQIRGTVDGIAGQDLGRLNMFQALSAEVDPLMWPTPRIGEATAPTYQAAAPMFGWKNDISVIEATGGTVTAQFEIQLNGAGNDCKNASPCTVRWSTTTPATATAGTSCTTGIDLLSVPSTTVTFTSGNETKTVSVQICSDARDENDESFTVQLTQPTGGAGISDALAAGTIVDDDATPTLSIDDVSRNEGNGNGTTSIVFTVTLSAASGRTVSVGYATANGTATGGACGTAGVDYASIPSASLTFIAGDTTETIAVDVCRDNLAEADETFLVNLSSAVNATIADAQGEGTIENDDNVAPVVAAANASVVFNEGSTAVNNGTYSDANGDTVTLSASVGTVTKTGTSTGTWNWSFGTTDGPAQGQTVTIAANDGAGGTASTFFALTVTNVAPTPSIAGAPATSPEGTAISLTGSGTDPSSVDTSAGFTLAWSVAKNGSPFGAGAGTTFAFTADDNASYVVTLTATDKDGGGGTTTRTISVTNVAPTATFSAPASVSEGSPIGLSLTGINDPSTVDAAAGFQYAFDCGAGYGALGPSASLSCPTVDNGSYTVNGRIIDKDGGFTDYTTTVVVNNVAPTPSIVGASATSAEGTALALSGSASDVSAADTAAGFAFAWSVSKDGSPFGSGGTGASFAFTPDDNASYVVTLSATDKDGGTGTTTTTIAVTNVAPSATLANTGPVSEGSPATISFSGQFDPSSADTATGFHYAFSCTNGNLSTATYAGSGTSSSTTCAYSDNGNKPVKARVIDKDGGFSEYVTTVVVNNVAPVITVVIGPAAPVAKSTSTSLTASFTDVGTGDTHTCAVNWDDLTTTAGTVTETNGSGTCTASHAYATAGVNTLTITVTDDDGAVASATYEFIVVYDPSAGFVTGGGWINAAPGSCVVTAATCGATGGGRANFGFVSKYQKGTILPAGETEFNFQDGSFDFHSSSYEYLSVNGYRAQYAGVGTVKGIAACSSGGCSFKLTAYDGNVAGGGGVDRFRIKIWAEPGYKGAIVYDNVRGGSDDMDAANPQTLGGGSIVIHK